MIPTNNHQLYQPSLFLLAHFSPHIHLFLPSQPSPNMQPNALIANRFNEPCLRSWLVNPQLMRQVGGCMLGMWMEGWKEGRKIGDVGYEKQAWFLGRLVVRWLVGCMQWFHHYHPTTTNYTNLPCSFKSYHQPPLYPSTCLSNMQLVPYQPRNDSPRYIRGVTIIAWLVCCMLVDQRHGMDG